MKPSLGTAALPPKRQAERQPAPVAKSGGSHRGYAALPLELRAEIYRHLPSAPQTPWEGLLSPARANFRLVSRECNTIALAEPETATGRLADHVRRYLKLGPLDPAGPALAAQNRALAVYCRAYDLPEFGLADEKKAAFGRAKRLLLPSLLLGSDPAALARLGEVLGLGHALQRIDLGYTALQPGSSQLLAPAFVSLRCLTALSLAGNCFGSQDVAYFLAQLAHCPALRSINLSNTGLDATALHALAAAVPQLTALRDLDLCYNELDDVPSLAALGTSLGAFGQLHSLALSGNQLGARGLQALAQGLGRATRLLALRLGATSLGAAGGPVVNDLLAALPNLRELYAGSNNFASGSLLRAPAGSARLLPPLQLVDFANNLLGDQEAVLLAKELMHHRRVRIAHLGDNLFGAVGAVALVLALHRCKDLTELSLSSTKLNKRPGQLLARGLQQWPALTSLDVSGCDIKDAPTAVSLASGLQHNRNLQTLRIFGNKLFSSPAVVAAWCQTLALLPALITLDLESVTLPGDSTTIAQLVASACDLRWLDISQNFLAEACPEALSAAFSRQPNLQDLAMNCNFYGELTVLQAVMPTLATRHLRHLALDSNDLTPADMASLAPQLAVFPSLRHLSLQDNDLDETANQDVASVRQLKSLSLYDNHYDEAGLDRLRQLLPFTAIEALEDEDEG